MRLLNGMRQCINGVVNVVDATLNSDAGWVVYGKACGRTELQEKINALWEDCHRAELERDAAEDAFAVADQCVADKQAALECERDLSRKLREELCEVKLSRDFYAKAAANAEEQCRMREDALDMQEDAGYWKYEAEVSAKLLAMTNAEQQKLFDAVSLQHKNELAAVTAERDRSNDALMKASGELIDAGKRLDVFGVIKESAEMAQQEAEAQLKDCRKALNASQQDFVAERRQHDVIVTDRDNLLKQRDELTQQLTHLRHVWLGKLSD